MRSLCVLCVLLSTAQGSDTLQHVSSRRHRNLGIKGELQTPSHLNKQTLLVLSGQDPRGTDRHDVLFTRLGSDVHLPLRYNLSKEKDKCDEFNWSWSYIGSYLSPISKSRRCNITRYNFTLFSNHETSPDGHLTLTSVTRANRGIYMVSVFKEEGTRIQQNYTLHVQVPPSDPVLEVSCHNGSLQISCFVEKGTNLVFSLSVNEEILLENTTNEQKRVNVTSSSPGPWDVHCSVRNHLEKKNKRERYVRCPVPLSAPIINASCQNDGTARVVCEVERGSNATYTWSVNRKHIHPSPAPNITINASEFASGAINVTCSAENSVSSEHSSTTEIFCDAPVSDPVLNASCLSNGSAVVTCWILGGTDPKFHLTVNGDVMPFPNMCSACFGLNHTISTRGPWNISCSVENKISKLMSNISSHSCPVYMESSCLSCLQKSLIGGAVAIIVTTSPLLIAYYYIGRNTKEE